MSNIDTRLCDLLEEIENDCLEELGYPPCSMSFDCSLKEGITKGHVICNTLGIKDFEFTGERIEAFRELFLSKLW